MPCLKGSIISILSDSVDSGSKFVMKIFYERSKGSNRVDGIPHIYLVPSTGLLSNESKVTVCLSLAHAGRDGFRIDFGGGFDVIGVLEDRLLNLLLNIDSNPPPCFLLYRFLWLLE